MRAFKFFVAAFALSLCALGVAQDVCLMNSGKQIDEVRTEYWKFALQHPDQTAMQQVVGTWYFENAVQDGSVQRIYETFHPDGGFEYSDQTCNFTCTQNQGYGMWVANTQADGSIYVLMNVTDLNRTNECTGFSATVQGNQMLTGGNPGTRVQ
jgi:hypothetical protein